MYSKALILCAAFMVLSSPVIAASFSILRDFSDENYEYYPHDVSADGSVVVGDIGPWWGGPFPAFLLLIQSYDIEFVYRVQNQTLGREWTHGIRLSADGTVVVGMHDDSLFGPFYWTRNSGMVFLQTPGSANGYTTAASSDGSVMVGFSTPTPGLGEALRWTKNGDVTALDNIIGYEYSKAYDVSHDGSVIVGISWNNREYQAFRCTQNDGTVGLGFLPGDNHSTAGAVSADGSVIVGWSGELIGEYPYDDTDNEEAFRWTQSGGMVGLGFLPGTDSSEAIDVSGDGSVVVGHSGAEPFIWDSINGMRSLEEVLTYDYNIDLSDFTITLVNAISADGGTIIGVGYSESEPFIGGTGYENKKGWIANIGTSKGSLEVTIEPQEAVSAGAQWQLDGGEWKNSRDSIIEIEIGDYTVNFNDITGWKAPDPQTVTVVALSKTSISVTYKKIEYGSLTVTIEPASAVNAGAKWRVGGGEWQDSGATQSGIPVGDHIVEFKTIANFATPGSQTVNLKVNETATITQTYIAQAGSLTVNISPSEAVSAGAMWRVYGGNWHISGETEHNLGVGNHIVEFSEIPDWIAPDLPGVAMNADQTTSFNGVYTKQQGKLTVTIEPAEIVSAGAKWRVNGGGWKNSGDSVTGLNDGTHTLEFMDVSGWTTPDSQSITITGGGNAVASGVYVEGGSDSGGDSGGSGDGGGDDGGGGGGGCFISDMLAK